MSGLIRLHITAEGQTEEKFVRRVLQPYLAARNIFVDARSVLTSKDKKAGYTYRGGLLSYDKARRDILEWIKQDHNPECRFSTMFDLYALPEDFPGAQEAKTIADPYERVAWLEQKLAEDMDHPGFIPYIQLYEFEALLFSEPAKFALEYLEHEKAVHELENILDSFGNNPELIDDGPDTAPSRRILANIPEYSKTSSGVIIAEMIGLDRMRAMCRHFDQWLCTLEALGS